METTAKRPKLAVADVTGYVAVEAVRGRSAVTRCFSKYPLKLIVPAKAGPSRTDAVWIYALTYGGGIVSGDCTRCEMSVSDGCTAVFTTQASTKVYKSVGSKSSEQVLEVLLEQGDTSCIAERMQDYQVIAMIIMIGPKLKHVQDQIQDDVKKMMSGCFHIPNPARGPYSRKQPECIPAKPALIASCSAFGPKAMGVVVRIAALTTESVYGFLRHHLASTEPFVGTPLFS